MSISKKGTEVDWFSRWQEAKRSANRWRITALTSIVLAFIFGVSCVWMTIKKELPKTLLPVKSAVAITQEVRPEEMAPPTKTTSREKRYSYICEKNTTDSELSSLLGIQGVYASVMDNPTLGKTFLLALPMYYAFSSESSRDQLQLASLCFRHDELDGWTIYIKPNLLYGDDRIDSSFNSTQRLDKNKPTRLELFGMTGGAAGLGKGDASLTPYLQSQVLFMTLPLASRNSGMTTAVKDVSCDLSPLRTYIIEATETGHQP